MSFKIGDILQRNPRKYTASWRLHMSESGCSIDEKLEVIFVEGTTVTFSKCGQWFKQSCFDLVKADKPDAEMLSKGRFQAFSDGELVALHTSICICVGLSIPEGQHPLLKDIAVRTLAATKTKNLMKEVQKEYRVRGIKLYTAEKLVPNAYQTITN